MKLEQIKERTSTMVAEHLKFSWALEWDDSSRGCQACHILTKDELARFIFVTWETDLRDDKGLIAKGFKVCISEMPKREMQSYSLCGQEQLIWSETYYRIGARGKNRWYSQDAEEARKATELQFARYRARNSAQKKVLPSTTAVVAAMQNVPGFEMATAKNLVIEKQNLRNHRGRTCPAYHVTLLNRRGNKKESRTYRLNNCPACR